MKFLILVIILFSFNSWSYHDIEEYRYANPKSETGVLGLSADRERVIAGDRGISTNKCDYGDPDLCVFFFDWIFTIPLNDCNGFKVKHNETTVSCAYRKEMYYLGAHRIVTTMFSTSPEGESYFYYTPELGLFLIEAISDGDRAIFLLVGEKGYGWEKHKIGK